MRIPIEDVFQYEYRGYKAHGAYLTHDKEYFIEYPADGLIKWYYNFGPTQEDVESKFMQWVDSK